MAENVIELIRFIESQGIQTSIISNAFLLTDKKIIEVIDSGLSAITISLDSLDFKRHDYGRGIDGAHEKAIHAIDKLIELKNMRVKPLWITIAVVVSKLNYDELIEIVNWTEDKGINGVIFQAINDTFFGEDPDFYDNKLWPMTKQETEKIVDALTQLKEFKKEKDIILNSEDQFDLMTGYFRKMHWLKNVRRDM